MEQATEVSVENLQANLLETDAEIPFEERLLQPTVDGAFKRQ